MHSKLKIQARIIFTAVWLFITTITVAQQAILQNPETGYAPVNGLKMYYEIYGQGKPIVLIHGAYQTIALCWSGLIPDLSKNRKVIAVEIQGHGHTMDIERPFSYNSLASDVIELLKYLKIDKADMLGFSVGGTIAMQVAVQQPEVVDRLVVLSTPYQYTGWLPEMRTMLKSLKPDFLDQTPYKKAHEGIYYHEDKWHEFVSKFVKFDTENFDLGDENMKNIKAQTLFIFGDNDGVDLTHKAKLYQLCGGNVFADMAGFPKSQMAILPNTSHVGLIMQPQKIAELVQPFLK